MGSVSLCGDGGDGDDGGADAGDGGGHGDVISDVTQNEQVQSSASTRPHGRVLGVRQRVPIR